MIRIRRTLAVACLALAAAACSDSAKSPAAPATTSTPQIPPNTSTGLGNPEVPIFSVSEADRSGGRGPCVFNPATGQFDCPAQTHEGLTVTMRYTLFDAQGNVQSAFNRETTASIKTETTATGTITRSGMTMTVNRSGVMVTSGLGPNATTHTVNGSEQGTVTSTMNGGGGNVTMNSSISDVTTNLVVPVRNTRDEAAYPLSGTRTHSATTTTTHSGQTRTMTMSRHETFNGTNIVQIVKTVNGVTERCTFDLAARTSTCGSR